jgi:quinol monooxygenase YgiN
MLIAIVNVHVKSDSIDAFKEITQENARYSIKEPGIARFDVLQQEDDPTRFILFEVYRNDDAPARHRETAHYQKWKEAATDLMAEPRTNIKYRNIFPSDETW